MSEIPEPGPTAQREFDARREPRTTITLLRHGEPDWTPSGTSTNDPALTPFGRAQAEAAARRLVEEGITSIYVSPYLRSQQTAEPLARACGVEPVTIDDLGEVGVAVDGLTQDEVDAYFTAGSRRPLAEHWEGWPGAETFHDFHERVTGALADILGRHGATASQQHDFTVWDLPERAEHIAIVAHGGTNAVALTHLLDVRAVPWEWARFEMHLCAFAVVQEKSMGPSGKVFSLQNFNEVDHLVAAGLR